MSYGPINYERLAEKLREELKASRFYSRFGFKRLPGQMLEDCSVGSLMFFADRLWIATIYTGGLYSLDENLNLELVKEVQANQFGRVYHPETDKIVIGKFLIDSDGKVTELAHSAAAAASLSIPDIADPDRNVLVLEGSSIYVTNMKTGEQTLWQTLDFRPSWSLEVFGSYLFAVSNHVYAANHGLWRWDSATGWTRLFDEWYHEVYRVQRGTGQEVLYAVGYDLLSMILLASEDGVTWSKYRLPFAAPAAHELFEGKQRMRIIEDWRVLADIGGILYILPSAYNPWGTETGVPRGLRPEPICVHGQHIFDFCSFLGALAIGKGQNFPRDVRVGQPNSGLELIPFGELWRWGKPRGYGAVWKDTSISAGKYSDPFLIYGFDKKTIHLWADTDGTFTIEVDPLGDGTWKVYDTVPVSAGGYKVYIMTGDAVWVRLSFDKAARVGVVIHVG